MTRKHLMPHMVAAVGRRDIAEESYGHGADYANAPAPASRWSDRTAGRRRVSAGRGLRAGDGLGTAKAERRHDAWKQHGVARQHDHAPSGTGGCQREAAPGKAIAAAATTFRPDERRRRGFGLVHSLGLGSFVAQSLAKVSTRQPCRSSCSARELAGAPGLSARRNTKRVRESRPLLYIGIPAPRRRRDAGHDRPRSSHAPASAERRAGRR